MEEKEMLQMKDSRTLKNFKVLIGTPQNEVKNYCFDDWIARASNLTYKNKNMLIVDNSITTHNKKKMVKMGLNAIHIKPRGRANQQYIADSLEVLRQTALREGFDFMLVLESDIFPPFDVIERLIMHQQRVVSGAYFIGHGTDSHLMMQLVEQRGDLLRQTTNVENGRDIVMCNGQLQKVYAAGLGCCLIHSSVLEQIIFRWEEGANIHPDSFFAADLNLLNIPQYIDTSFICEHRNRSWSAVSDSKI